MSEGAERDYHGDPRRVEGTGSPAEDREEERARNRLWDLKEEAKWGKDGSAQKKAIENLGRVGAPSMAYLEEILSVVPPGEIRQYCLDVIRGISGMPAVGNEDSEKVLNTKVMTSG